MCVLGTAPRARDLLSRLSGATGRERKMGGRHLFRPLKNIFERTYMVMTGKQIVLHHLKKSAEHHTNLAEAEAKIFKAHGDIAEGHTNQVLAQGHRDLADHHNAKAQHHNAQARHLLMVHQHVSGITPELFDEHSDAGDELRTAAHAVFLKRACGIEL